MTHPWRTNTVDSDGETIHYEITGADTGDAPVVVLGHGAGGSHASWFQQVPVLADAGYRVITWDTRGFGRSSYRTGVHGPEAGARDLRAVLDANGVERAHVVGQSMGGWWVTTFALASPTRVRSLTLANTIGGLWTDELFAHATANRIVADPDVRLGVHSALSPKFGARDPARAFLYQQINTFHAPPINDVLMALATPIDHAAIDALDLPVLAITSVDDQLFPPKLVAESIGRLRRGQVIEIADAGHSTYFERPEPFNAALLEFLACW